MPMAAVGVVVGPWIFFAVQRDQSLQRTSSPITIKDEFAIERRKEKEAIYRWEFFCSMASKRPLKAWVGTDQKWILPHKITVNKDNIVVFHRGENCSYRNTNYGPPRKNVPIYLGRERRTVYRDGPWRSCKRVQVIQTEYIENEGNDLVYYNKYEFGVVIPTEVRSVERCKYEYNLSSVYLDIPKVTRIILTKDMELRQGQGGGG